MSVTKTIEIEARVDKAEKDLEGVAKSVQKIDKNLEDVKDSSNVAAKGIKGIGTALKAAGIGLAIAAFGKLVEVFNENQKVADAFNTTFEALSLGFNDFFNFLDRNIGNVIDYFKAIFDDPVQSIKNLGQAIKDNIIERFNSTLEMLGYLSTAFKQVFEGDFDGAMESAKMAGKEYIDVLTGVDGTVDKVADTVTKAVTATTSYVKSTVDAAKSNVDLSKSAEVAAVKQQGLIEKYDRQAELQRQIRDDESKTIEERIAANVELGKILDEQEAAMLKQVDVQLASAQAQYDKNKNQENYIALLEAENEKEAVKAQIAGFRSEQLTNINSLERERVDLIKEERENDLEYFAEEADRKAKEDEDKKKAHEEELKQKEEIRQATLNNLDTIRAVAGEETAIGKALFIAKQGMIIKEQIMKAKATLSELGLIAAKGGADIASGAGATAKVGFPQNIPLLIAFAAQAAGIFASIKSAVNAAKGSASKMGGSGGSSSVQTPRISVESVAPAFNVVGASETNQLAQAIGQDEKQPIKAFVVSNDVSTAQALDRNIVETASIG
jgi:hypothetical protein